MKAWLLRKLLTPDQQVLLAADRRTVLRAMLHPEHARVLDALEAGERYVAPVEFTPEEAQALESFFKSPVWAKLDTALIGWLQELAQRAIAAEPDRMVAEGKFALGARAGVEMAKSLSRLAAAHRSESVQAEDTASDLLATHSP